MSTGLLLELEGSKKERQGNKKLLDRALDSMRVKWGVVDWKINCQESECPNRGNDGKPFTFTFTKGEQIFYKNHGFNSPRRCFDCRKKLKKNKLERLLVTSGL